MIPHSPPRTIKKTSVVIKIWITICRRWIVIVSRLYGIFQKFLDESGIGLMGFGSSEVGMQRTLHISTCSSCQGTAC